MLGVLAFTLVIGLATGAVFGLAPLLHLAPDATSLALKEGGHADDGRRGTQSDPARPGGGRSRARGGARHRRRPAAAHGDESVERRLRLQSRGSSSRSPSRCRTRPTRSRAGAGASTSGCSSSCASTGGVQSVAAMSGLPPLRQVERQRHQHRGLRRAAREGRSERRLLQHRHDRLRRDDGDSGRRRARVSADRRARHHGADQRDDGADVLQGVRARSAAACGRRPPTALPWFTIVGVLKDVKQGGVDKKTGTELYFNFEQLDDTRRRSASAR